MNAAQIIDGLDLDPFAAAPTAKELFAAHKQALRFARHVDGDQRMYWVNGAANIRRAIAAMSDMRAR